MVTLLHAALDEVATLRNSAAEAASARRLLDANVTASHAPLDAAVEALGCSWVADAHAAVQAQLCAGVTDAWALLGVLLLLLGTALLLEARHAAAMVGAPAPRRGGGCLRRCRRHCCCAERGRKRDVASAVAKSEAAAKAEAAAAAERDAWERERAVERALEEAIAAEKEERHQVREERRRAQPPVAPRDFASSFLTARVAESEADEHHRPRVKLAWGAQPLSDASSIPIGCFD